MTLQIVSRLKDPLGSQDSTPTPHRDDPPHPTPPQFGEGAGGLGSLPAAPFASPHAWTGGAPGTCHIPSPLPPLSFGLPNSRSRCWPLPPALWPTNSAPLWADAKQLAIALQKSRVTLHFRYPRVRALLAPPTSANR